LCFTVAANSGKRRDLRSDHLFMSKSARRIVVGISGASGPIYGIRALEALRATGDTEIHLILTEAALQTIALETRWSQEEVERLGHVVYRNHDLTARVASGSYPTDGMLIAPCSMRSLGEIAHSTTRTLLTRAADVHLKERRRLVLMVRETPLHSGHLRNMLLANEAGAILLPPIPAFYHHPSSIDDIVAQSVGKALDLLAVPHQLYRRWNGD
jgi:4-hydroxy-3-polyprenylbenzoate decarboxylase